MKRYKNRQFFKYKSFILNAIGIYWIIFNMNSLGNIGSLFGTIVSMFFFTLKINSNTKANSSWEMWYAIVLIKRKQQYHAISFSETIRKLLASW